MRERVNWCGSSKSFGIAIKILQLFAMIAAVIIIHESGDRHSIRSKLLFSLSIGFIYVCMVNILRPVLSHQVKEALLYESVCILALIGAILVTLINKSSSLVKSTKVAWFLIGMFATTAFFEIFAVSNLLGRLSKIKRAREIQTEVLISN